MVIYALPVIGALIGWLANYLAVKMLFYPRQEHKLFGWRCQGLFPRRQKELAGTLGRFVSQDLFSFDDLKQALRNKAREPEVRSIIEFHIEQALTRRLSNLVPFLPPKLSESLLSKIKAPLQKEVATVVEDVVRNLGDEVEGSLDVGRMVEEKVEGLSGEKLELALGAMLNGEFRFIELAGAGVGLAVGGVALGILTACGQ